MKTLILALAALLLGLVGGTAWTVSRWETPADPASVDVAVPSEPDTTGGRRDTALVQAATPDPSPHPVATPLAESPEPVDSACRVATFGQDSTAAPPSPADTAMLDVQSALEAVARDTGDAAGEGTLQARAVDGAKQLARIFAAMQPRDAAAVLDHMTDAEITSILGHIQPRQAASILSSMDADRAALLSRSVLGGGAP